MTAPHATAPRILVSGVERDWSGARRSGVNSAYVHALLGAGGLPLIVPPGLDPACAPRLLDGAEALLLSGGEDIDPRRYGAVPSPRLGPVDPRRDALELALYAEARARGLPVLAICRGIQLVNVAHGGTLWQDLPTERMHGLHHEQTASRHERHHVVSVIEGSRLHAALGVTAAEVNSIHHQGLRELGAGLVPVAWAPDGLVEGVETADGPWMLAVQWHPEEMHAEAGPEARLVRTFVQAAERPAPAWAAGSRGAAGGAVPGGALAGSAPRGDTPRRHALSDAGTAPAR